MSEEKKMILEMLQAEKITAEEAKKLLEALDSDQSRPNRKTQTDQHPGGNFVEDIFDSIRTGLSNLNLAFDFGDANRIVLEESLTGNFDAETVNLDLKTRNGSIRVETWDQPGFHLDVIKSVRATTREQAEEMVADLKFAEADGGSLRAGDHGSRDMRIRVAVSLRLRLPRQHKYFGEAVTTNGSIEIRELDLLNYHVQSANGSLKLYGINAHCVEAKTINGSLKIEGSIADLKGNATNGSISVVNMAAENNTDVKTVNGRVEVRIPTRDDVAIAAIARTTAGSIRLEHPTMRVLEEIRKPGNRFLRAATGNDIAADIELDLSSVNGSIRITGL